MDILELKTYLNCDNVFLRSLIQKFIVEVTEITENIENAGEAGKWETVKLSAHKMLSSVRIFEIKELIELLEKIEINAEIQMQNNRLPAKSIEALNNDISKLRPLVTDTLATMETTMQELVE